MKKKKKYLPLYYKWMKTGRLPYGFGLCMEFCDLSTGQIDPNIMQFKPLDVTANTYWASGKLGENYLGVFTSLRQTILLFVAAQNGEL